MYGSKQLWTTKAKELWFCSHKIYLYIFSCTKRKNIWPGYEFKLSSFSSTHIHRLPPMGPPNPIYELVIIQTCLLHVTQITIAMQGLSSLTNTFYVFFSLVFFLDYSWISLFRVKMMDSWLGASDDGSWTIFFYDFLQRLKGFDMLEKIGKNNYLWKLSHNVQRIMKTTQKRQHCDGWMCIGKWYMLFIYLVWLFDRTVSESALLFIYIQSSLLVWNPVFSQEQIYPKGSLNLT